MDNYTEINFQFMKFVNGKAVGVATIVVDTEDDIPTPIDRWQTGSICYIAETHACKVLNHDRQWK